MLEDGGAQLGRLRWGGVYGKKQQDGVTGTSHPQPRHVMLFKCTFCEVKSNHKQQKWGILEEKKPKPKILAEG